MAVRQSALLIMKEQYREYDNKNLTLREYIEREAENDPTFFNWLFDDWEKDNTKLCKERQSEWKEFIESVKV